MSVYLCEVPGCGKTYKYKRGLQAHCLINHVVSDNSTGRKCIVCSVALSDLSSMRHHRSTRQGPARDTVVCPKCGVQVFASNMGKHRKRCRDNGDLRCPRCTKECQSATKLTRQLEDARAPHRRRRRRRREETNNESKNGRENELKVDFVKNIDEEEKLEVIKWTEPEDDIQRIKATEIEGLAEEREENGKQKEQAEDENIDDFSILFPDIRLRERVRMWLARNAQLVSRS